MKKFSYQSMIDYRNPHGIDFLQSRFLPQANPNYSDSKKIILHRNNKSRRIRSRAFIDLEKVKNMLRAAELYPP
jgi:hypothetical protein